MLTLALLGVIGRTAEFGAVLVYLGVASEWVLSRSTREATDAALARRRLRLSGRVVAVLIVGLAFQLIGQSVTAFGWAEGLRLESLQLVGVESRWGESWIRRVWIAGLAAVVLMIPQRFWMPVGVAGIVALGAAATGHALSVAESPFWPVVLIFLHVVAGGLWLGTLAVTFWMYPRSADSATQTAALERFSRLARFAAPTAFLTGVVAAIVYLDSWGALVTTGYGRVLLLKVAALATAAGMGAYHWLVALPRVRREPSHLSRVRDSVGLELAFGAVGVVLTAVLVIQNLEAMVP